MFKIAAFLTFRNKLNKKILYQKSEVKKKFGNQTYLNHPVHLTLFTLNIKNINLIKKAYQKIENKKNKKTFKINFDKAGLFANDPLTQGHTLYYGLKKNTQLIKTQINHLRYINKEIFVEKKIKQKLNNSQIEKDYKKYGFPFIGKNWIPHVTIASIKNIKKNDDFIKKFLKTKIIYKEIVSDLKFYKINKNKHTYLFKTNIIHE